jgi:TonB family protein
MGCHSSAQPKDNRFSMSEDLHPSPVAPRDADRRAHPRHVVRSLAYVELGERNGGIILNLSEGGMTVKAAMGLTEMEIPRVRFQLTQTHKSIETRGRISWVGGAKKTAGLQFLDLSDQALSDIREWIRLENSSTPRSTAAPAPPPSQPQTGPRETMPHRQVIGPAKGQIARQARGQSSENAAGEERIDERAVDEAIDRALRAVKKGAKAKPEVPVLDTQELDSAPPTVPEDRLTDAVTSPLADLAAVSVPDPVANPLVPPVPPATPRVTPSLNIPSSGHFGPLPPGSPAKVPPVADLSPHQAAPVTPSQATKSWSRQTASAGGNEFKMPKYVPPPTPRPSIWSGRTLIFLGVFCFLAVGSLLAGWIAGRGTLSEVYARVAGKNSNVDQGGPSGDFTVADGNPGVSQIEIVDTNNNRRMISLSGSTFGSMEDPTNTPGNGTASSGNSRATRKTGADDGNFVPLPGTSAPSNIGAFPSPKTPGNLASGGRTTESETEMPARTIPADKAQTPGARPNQVTESPLSAAQSVAPTGTASTQKAELLHWVEPSYPEAALDQNVQGTVRLHVMVATDGAVESVQALSGAQLLIPAAIEAVRQWRYKPTLVDGKAVETASDISLVFTIPAANPR